MTKLNKLIIVDSAISNSDDVLKNTSRELDKDIIDDLSKETASK